MGIIAACGEKDFQSTAEGAVRLHGFGIDIDQASKSRRYFARQCLDWSERRCHLAGSLGAAMTQRMFELAWIERSADTRAIDVTVMGVRGLASEFGLNVSSSLEQVN